MQKNEAIPTIELEGRIHKEMLNRYRQIHHNEDELLCSSFIDQIPEI